jgi:hypothetical protein
MGISMCHLPKGCPITASPTGIFFTLGALQTLAPAFEFYAGDRIRQSRVGRYSSRLPPRHQSSCLHSSDKSGIRQRVLVGGVGQDFALGAAANGFWIGGGSPARTACLTKRFEHVIRPRCPHYPLELRVSEESSLSALEYVSEIGGKAPGHTKSAV